MTTPDLPMRAAFVRSTRRRFMQRVLIPPAAAAVGGFLRIDRARAVVQEIAADTRPPEQTARDASFWAHVAQAFSVDRSIVNLNNGGVSPSPTIVLDAMKRHLDYSNTAPAHALWNVLEPRRESVRVQLARLLGCDPEEVALTRNASEGLETCQLGFDLKPGDEVLTSNQDYPRMIVTFRQRQRRERIRLVTASLPAPCDDPADIVRAFERHITPRTRLMLVSHVCFLTGAIFPAAELVRLGRSRGIPVIVDGAHAFAHLDFRIADLDCDYFAASLHKWLFAPHGTGLLYVRRSRIRDLWPLMAAPEKLDDDIRKFEEIGTHPAANHLAIAEAVTFHEGLGAARKLARLIYLRDYWADVLAAEPRVRFWTSRRPGRAGALATFEIEGVHSDDLALWLWNRHHILVTSIRHEDFSGIRISPSVYTLTSELDRFIDAMRYVIRHGLPSDATTQPARH